MIPTSIFMFLTRSCNLACNHCYVSAEPSLKGHMTLEVFEKTVTAFISKGINDFRFTGGEPTINPHFGSFLTFMAENNLRPRLITNGIRIMRMKSPEDVLSRLSRCWVSAYGITADQHRAIGGVSAVELDQVIEFVGQQAQSGHWIGLSTLLTEGTPSELDYFLEQVAKARVRYLRFLFAEPSGRALSQGMIFGKRMHAREDALSVLKHLRSSALLSAFDFLSINDPFDLDSKYESPSRSCMLRERRMWSISPEGDVYSCCFNIYDPAHLVRRAFSINSPEPAAIEEFYAARCRALISDWWAGANANACPINAIALLNSEESRR